VRQALPAGDYGVADDSGELIAVVERKSLADLVATVTNGKLRFAIAALAALPRAAVVVEDRYSAIFKLTRVRPRVVADGIAELQVRYPTIPIVFCETASLPRNGPTATSARHWSSTASTSVARFVLPSSARKRQLGDLHRRSLHRRSLHRRSLRSGPPTRHLPVGTGTAATRRRADT
jgi:ERCC4 domain